jgi:hypothetical protein
MMMKSIAISIIIVAVVIVAALLIFYLYFGNPISILQSITCTKDADCAPGGCDGSCGNANYYRDKVFNCGRGSLGSMQPPIKCVCQNFLCEKA